MFPVGHVLGETYRVERLLGKGGMACVYVVSHLRLPRRFALKVITAPAAQGSEYMMRFRREAEILAELEHPNLVTVNDWNVTPDGKPYLVMELLQGEDLAQCLHRTGALPQKVALSIFAQAVEALQVAHARNIVHRDLKPANIFLCKNGMVPYFAKVLDFGIAKSAQHAGGAITEQLVLMGTPAYMAPEQAQGNIAIIDARTDQFALALVLYEMLTGRSAFYRRGEAPLLTISRVITEDPDPIPDERLNRAVMRALRKDPDERYPSLAEFADAVLSCAPEPIELPEKTDRLVGEQAIAPEHRAKPSGAMPAAVPPRTLPPPEDAAPPPVGAPSPGRPGSGEMSVHRAVLSNITQPGVELVPHKKARRSLRQRLLLTSISGGALLMGGLLLGTSMVSRVGSHSAAAPLGLMSGTPVLTSAPVTPPVRPRQLHREPSSTPQTPQTVVRELASPPVENKSEAPPSTTSTANLTSRPKPPRHTIPAHVQPILTGVAKDSTAGKRILSCLETVFGANPRRFGGLVIQLNRTDHLKVCSTLPPERSLWLEDCLSNLPTQDTPRQATITMQPR